MHAIHEDGHLRRRPSAGGSHCPLGPNSPVDGAAFRVYVGQVLAPTLGRGDVVVLDNMPPHKVAGIREAITARRAQLFYMPPLSTDMNLTEMAFVKLNALLRQDSARTIAAVIERIWDILDRFRHDACQDFFHAAGY